MVVPRFEVVKWGRRSRFGRLVKAQDVPVTEIFLVFATQHHSSKWGIDCLKSARR
jgi:hypothetical protein